MDNEDTPNDLLSTQEVRLTTSKKLKEVLQPLNKEFDALSEHLDNGEEVFSDTQKEDGSMLLQQLSERINAIKRLNKVLENAEDEVFSSDIELCEEFIEDTEQFSIKLVEFRKNNSVE